MTDVTQDGGTAAFLGKDIAYKIAAKTGTAQVFSLKGQEYDEENLPERLKDHALFIAYAPAEQPKIALAVIVENGGHGGSTAGPIAKQVFDYYIKLNNF
jgi:penicillin-binding protein 2